MKYFKFHNCSGSFGRECGLEVQMMFGCESGVYVQSYRLNRTLSEDMDNYILTKFRIYPGFTDGQRRMSDARARHDSISAVQKRNKAELTKASAFRDKDVTPGALTGITGTRYLSTQTDISHPTHNETR